MSDLDKNIKGVKRHSLIRSVKRLFSATKSVNAKKLYPKRYASYTYLDDSNSQGLKFLTEVGRTTKHRVGNDIF